MKLEETIRALYDAGVEFVLIGGAAMGLSLEGLIKAKTAAGRPRDLYVLPELRALAEAKRKQVLSDWLP